MLKQETPNTEALRVPELFASVQARCAYPQDNLGGMSEQPPVYALLSAARLQPYLVAAGHDNARALDLYLWANEVAGAMHAQLAYVELAVRNALDPVLADWNSAQPGGYGRDWTAQDGAAAPLYDVLKLPLNRARNWANDEVSRRQATHPRQGVTPTHDDVLVQLTFGAWTSLIRGQVGGVPPQQQLWEEATHQAFPQLSNTEASRYHVGTTLYGLQLLRNRIAHHDNLLLAVYGVESWYPLHHQ